MCEWVKGRHTHTHTHTHTHHAKQREGERGGGGVEREGEKHSDLRSIDIQTCTKCTCNQGRQNIDTKIYTSGLVHFFAILW